MAMTNSISRKDYIKQLKKEYREVRKAKDRKLKTRLLDTAITFTGYNRKYIIRLLNNRNRKHPSGFSSGGRGRTPIYSNAEFNKALLICWRAANCSCAENLQPYIPNLIQQLESCGELEVTQQVRRLLLGVSISTIARKLKSHNTRSRVPIGISTTRPGDLLKSQIAVRKGRWDEARPGFLETDTVAHCGDQNVGTYIHSYNFVDIATSWSEQVAAMGMGQRDTVIAFNNVRKRFVFPILGIDSDNGAEYINGHLYRYCQNEDITFTRSRPYRKNDNAHIEQKNNTAIRKMVGYARYDTKQQLAILNELYSGPLRLYLNYCQPTRKRKFKFVDTSTGKVKKTYFEAKTPYQRVLESEYVDDSTKQMLQSQHNKLNPVKLLAEIHSLLERLDKTLR